MRLPARAALAFVWFVNAKSSPGGFIEHGSTHAETFETMKHKERREGSLLGARQHIGGPGGELSASGREAASASSPARFFLPPSSLSLYLPLPSHFPRQPSPLRSLASHACPRPRRRQHPLLHPGLLLRLGHSVRPDRVGSHRGRPRAFCKFNWARCPPPSRVLRRDTCWQLGARVVFQGSNLGF